MSEFSRLDLAPPQDIILPSRSVLGAVDLDPYSTPTINRVVMAKRIYNRDEGSIEDMLARDWEAPGEKRVFVGIPIGAGATRRILNKLLREYRAGRVSHAIAWIGHNEAIIRMPWLWDFPMCLPYRRLRPCYWDDELDKFRNTSPSDWSAVVYLPPVDDSYGFHSGLSKFHVAFSPIGRVVFNEYSGEDDWTEAYKVAMKQPYDFRW
jgi:hypothetical protein